MSNSDLYVQICRVGGPIALFICTPIITACFAWVVWKALEQGQVVSKQTILGMISFVGVCIFIGIGACRIGLGWFGGRR